MNDPERDTVLDQEGNCVLKQFIIRRKRPKGVEDVDCVRVVTEDEESGWNSR